MSQVIVSEAWRHFVTPKGEKVDHKRLTDFIEAQPPHGIGLSMETTARLLDESAAKAAAEKVRTAIYAERLPANPSNTNGPNGKAVLCDTNNRIAQQDAGYVVSRLKRDDTELAQQVVNGEITANAAAVKAGIRHKYARIRTDDVTRAVTKLLEVYELDEVLSTLRNVK